VAAKKAARSNPAKAARTAPKQLLEHSFKPGQSGNPKGRPKGSRDKINEAFLRDLSAAWEKHGKTAIEKVAKSDPTNFVKVVAGLIPKELKVDGDINHQHDHQHRAVSDTADWITGLLASGAGRSPSKSLPH